MESSRSERRSETLTERLDKLGEATGTDRARLARALAEFVLPDTYPAVSENPALPRTEGQVADNPPLAG